MIADIVMSISLLKNCYSVKKGMFHVKISGEANLGKMIKYSHSPSCSTFKGEGGGIGP